MSTIPAAHYRMFAVVGVGLAAAGALVTLKGEAPAPQPKRAQTATSAIPDDALVVVSADLTRLRASALGERLRAQSREVSGLGDLQQVCGFDPIESFDGAAFAIPTGGADGDFGVSAVGDKVGGAQLLACTTKVIAARGGKPLASRLGSFDTVRDAATGAPAGEIAARPEGPFLLGAGSYLRTMVDAADGRVAAVTADGPHARLAAALGGEPLATATLVLGARQRATIADEIARSGGRAPPAIGRIGAAALGVETRGERVGLHVIFACDDSSGALEVAGALGDLRARKAESPLARLSGVASLLAAIQVEVERDLVHARLVLPLADAEALLGLLVGGGRSGAPTPVVTADPAAPPSASAPLPEASTSAAPSASTPPAGAPAAPRKKRKAPTASPPSP